MNAILYRCSSLCKIEPGCTCSGNKNSKCKEICGDGKNIGQAQCDDGNTKNGDGCSSDCKVEKGWRCYGGGPFKKDTCVEICGDGIDLGYYPCDDGNTNDGDG